MEVDGEAHDRGDRPGRDERRDAWLRERGVRVLRVPAGAVLADLDAAVRHIVATATPEAGYPSTAFGGPPPPPGED